MLLSIIIPIFKVEEYINTCFESIYSQELDESTFEVIAVNDGTPDQSMRVVRKYQSSHDNLKIINQTNAGVSVARNNGLLKASGLYVTFIDPDDFICEGTLNKLLSILECSDKDMIIMRALKDKVEVFPWRGVFQDRDIIDGVGMYLKGYNRGSVWGVAYKKDFLEKYEILFPVGVRNGEDSIFFCLCQLWAQHILFLDIFFYNVYVRPGSATTSMSRYSIDLYKKTAHYIHSIIVQNENNCTHKQLSLLSNTLYRCVSQWVYSSLLVEDVSLNYLLNSLDIRQFIPIIHKYTQGFSFSSKLGLILMSKSFSLYYLLVKVKSHVSKS